MEFSKHHNYRNPQYLNWLRKQNCLVLNTSAECAHHVRLKTNGGKGLKPSDYFCIPLTHEYHTIGVYALHQIGEDSFFKQFKLKVEVHFIFQLRKYLKEIYNFTSKSTCTDLTLVISDLVAEIEMRRPASDIFKKVKIKKKKNNDLIKLPKQSESEYYQKAQEYRRQKSKEMRDAIKVSKYSNSFKQKRPVGSPTKQQNAINREYYEKAKKLKKEQTRTLKAVLLEEEKNIKLKTKSNKLSTKQKDINKEFYENSKELKRKHDKENRDKNKIKASGIRKELYRRVKERQKEYKESNLESP